MLYHVDITACNDLPVVSYLCVCKTMLEINSSNLFLLYDSSFQKIINLEIIKT